MATAATGTDLIRILNANFRNSPQVTDIANRLLHIKNEKKASIALMEYALVYRDQRLLNSLVQGGFKTAKHPDKAKAMPVLEHFPESIVPARRKKRPYISSILSKNEINRDAPTTASCSNAGS